MSAPAPAALPASLETAGRAGLVAFVLGAAVCAWGVATDPAQFYRSYLTGYVWMLGFALGPLGILMLHHLSRGVWGVMIRRPLEAAARTLPLAAVLFLPIVPGMHDLYEWTHAEVVAKDPLLLHKAPWLNVPGFLLRAALYFAVWIGFTFVLSGLSQRQDRTGDPSLWVRMRSLSAAGVILYVVTMSFASMDWMMSLTPHWYSTIYGLYAVIGQSVTAMAFVALVVLALGSGGSPAVPFQKRHLHDYGKLLFAFVLVWTYFGVSQFLIIWSGNLPEETSWYVPRMHGAWKATSVVLVLLHYVLPFFLLLSRDRKRSARRLAPVAALLLVTRWLDVHWLVAPAFSGERFSLHVLDVAAPVALGGAFLWAFVRQLKGRALLPAHDPFLKEALAHE